VVKSHAKISESHEVMEVKLHTFPVFQFTDVPWLTAMQPYLKVMEAKLHRFPVFQFTTTP
jgi:hypothetical protein